MTDAERLQALLSTTIGDFLGPRTHPVMVNARMEEDVVAIVATGEIAEHMLQGLRAMGLVMEKTEGQLPTNPLATNDLSAYYGEMFAPLKNTVACPSCNEDIPFKDWKRANQNVTALIDLVDVFADIGKNKKLTPYLSKVVPQIVADLMTQDIESRALMERLMDALQRLIMQARPEEFET